MHVSELGERLGSSWLSGSPPERGLGATANARVTLRQQCSAGRRGNLCWAALGPACPGDWGAVNSS